MSKSSLSLALKIAVLLQEYSANDVKEAVKILTDTNNNNTDLLHYLSLNSGKKSQRRPKKPLERGAFSKPIDEITSRAVLDLEKSEPEKYAVLLEFDKLIRQGKVLSEIDSLRRFGESISKNFRARKSRRDSISALMDLLSGLELQEIDKHISNALEIAPRDGSTEYQKLASFLIRGGRE